MTDFVQMLNEAIDGPPVQKTVVHVKPGRGLNSEALQKILAYMDEWTVGYPTSEPLTGHGRQPPEADPSASEPPRVPPESEARRAFAERRAGSKEKYPWTK